MTTLSRGRRESAALRHVRDFSRDVACAEDLETLFAILQREIEDQLHADTIWFGLYDELGRTVDVVHQSEFGITLPGGSFPLGRGITSEVIRRRESRLIRHWTEEAPPVQIQYLSGTPGLPQSATVVPIVAGDSTLGVIAAHRYQPDGFDEDDLLHLEVMAAQAGTAIARLRGSAQLAAQLRQRVSELESVLGAMPDAVVLLDREARIIRLNRAARDLLCADTDGVVIGQRLQDHVGGAWPLGAAEISQAVAPLLAALQKGELPAACDVELEAPGRRVLSFSGSPLFDPDNVLTGSVLVIRDVTTPHRIEELKDEMLSVASHDLRTPVTVIRTEAQLLHRELRRRSVTIEQLDDGIGSILRQTRRLAKLLGLLLDVSRIEAGRFEIYRTRVDLRTLASRAIDAIQATTDTHHLVLTIHGSTSGDWDEARIEQVLTNLLMNAVKYSPDGGQIEVAIRGQDDTVRLDVRDQGVGLSADEAQHVFDRYFRANSTRRLEGSGLGLYICHSIVAAHGGLICVESPGPGRGSTFCVVLPRHAER